MRREMRTINGEDVMVLCEFCPICGEYQERRDDNGEYIKGHDCGH